MYQYFLKRMNPTTYVDGQIAAILEEMETIGVTSDEYPKMLGYLERLSDINKTQRPNPVSRDTLALIFGNIMGIVAIVAYEQKHVITSKAFNQIIRPR